MGMFDKKTSKGASNQGSGGNWFEGRAELLCRLIKAPERENRSRIGIVPAEFEIIAIKKCDPGYMVGQDRKWQYTSEGGKFQEDDDKKWFSFVGSAFSIRLGKMEETLEDIGLDVSKYDLETNRGQGAAQDDVDDHLKKLSKQITAGEGDGEAGRYVFINCRLNKRKTFTKCYFNALPAGAVVIKEADKKKGIKREIKLDDEFREFLVSEGWAFEGTGKPYGGEAPDEDDGVDHDEDDKDKT